MAAGNGMHWSTEQLSDGRMRITIFDGMTVTSNGFIGKMVIADLLRAVGACSTQKIDLAFLYIDACTALELVRARILTHDCLVDAIETVRDQIICTIALRGDDGEEVKYALIIDGRAPEKTVQIMDRTDRQMLV